MVQHARNSSTWEAERVGNAQAWTPRSQREREKEGRKEGREREGREGERAHSHVGS